MVRAVSARLPPLPNSLGSETWPTTKGVERPILLAFAASESTLSCATIPICGLAAPIFSDCVRNGQEVTVLARLSEARFFEAPRIVYD